MQKNILLADDEEDILAILKRYLENDGFGVTVARDGQEALDKASANKFDLIILDVMMPKINGWEVCRKIKAEPETSKVPVFILTAKSQDVDALMSYEIGADEFITKPFDYNQILKSIIKHT